MGDIAWPPWRWSWFTGFNILSRGTIENGLRYPQKDISENIQLSITSFREFGRVCEAAQAELEKIKRVLEAGCVVVPNGWTITELRKVGDDNENFND